MDNISNEFTLTNPKDLQANPFSLFANDWVLVTSGNEKKYNTMTASWGGVGVIWNKNVATIYIRPQRYTYEFIEKNDLFTITVLQDKYREALKFCGSHSGLSCDKAAECGITPILCNNAITFEEAKMVFVCKKLYYNDIDKNNFVESEIDQTNYPNHDYHRMYIGEIVACYVK